MERWVYGCRDGSKGNWTVRGIGRMGEWFDGQMKGRMDRGMENYWIERGVEGWMEEWVEK